MEKLIFSIADLSVCIETPHYLEITGESDPFLKFDETNYDEHITLVPVDSLPPMKANGVWHQDRYYVGIEEGEVFHIRSAPNVPPFAMVEYIYGNHVRILYLRHSKDMIFQSRYLLNMLGVEQILLNHGGLILHASFIRWQGRAFYSPPHPEPENLHRRVSGKSIWVRKS